jgi:hypothetical protein
LTHAYLVLFSSFNAFGADLKHGDHPHQVLATSSSKRVRGNASAQPFGKCHDEISTQVRGTASTHPNLIKTCSDFQKYAGTMEGGSYRTRDLTGK